MAEISADSRGATPHFMHSTLAGAMPRLSSPGKITRRFNWQLLGIESCAQILRGICGAGRFTASNCQIHILSVLLKAEAVGARQAQRPDIHPTYEWGHLLLGVVLAAKVHRDAALIEMERVNVVGGRQLRLVPT
jgi:hypothetical protein